MTCTTKIAPRLIAAVVFGSVVFAAASALRAEEGTYAQRVACTPDAWRLCSDQIPDVDAVKACMIAKRAQLSAACRATFPRTILARQ